MADAKVVPQSSGWDMGYLVKPALTGALFVGANATIVPGGEFSIKQGVVSAGSDALGSWVGSYMAGMLTPNAQYRGQLEPYFFQPLGSAAMYVLIGKCITKVDGRGWMVQFLTQLGASAVSNGLVQYTPLGGMGKRV